MYDLTAEITYKIVPQQQTEVPRLNSSRERKPRKTRGRRFQITSMICTYIPTAVYPSVCSTHGDDASTAREPLFLRSIIRNTCARLLLYRPTLDTHVCRGTRAKRNQQQETSTLIANATKKTCDKLLRLRGEGVRVSSLFVGTRQGQQHRKGRLRGTT